jgi:hypothetical protein
MAGHARHSQALAEACCHTDVPSPAGEEQGSDAAANSQLLLLLPVLLLLGLEARLQQQHPVLQFLQQPQVLRLHSPWPLLLLCCLQVRLAAVALHPACGCC